MQVSARTFSDMLNKCLDENDVPANTRERTNVLSKMLDIPKQLAYSLLTGYQAPDENIIKKFMEEFEVEL